MKLIFKLFNNYDFQILVKCNKDELDLNYSNEYPTDRGQFVDRI